MPVERDELEQLEIIYMRLLIEWQQMQNLLLKELIKSGIAQNREIIEFNKLARSWNEMNTQRPMPPNMYT